MCPVCTGKEILVSKYFNGYSVEIDNLLRELTVWQGDTYLASVPIEYCPVCGARMNGGIDDATN